MLSEFLFNKNKVIMKTWQWIASLIFFSLGGLLVNVIFASPPVKENLAEITFQGRDKIRVGFFNNSVSVELQPRKGEGAFRFAERVMKDWKNNFKKISEYNHNKPLQAGKYVSFPFNKLNEPMQGIVLKALFPNDTAEEDGWAHRVLYPGETISFISGIFAKVNISSAQLAKHNSMSNRHILKQGDLIIIPWDWLREKLELQSIKVRKPLIVKKDKTGKSFAYYRIKKGETLYSSVVIRFTGRMIPEEVNRLAEKIQKLNKIKDPKFVVAGSYLKIMPEWLSEDYLIPNVTPTPVPKTQENAITNKKYPIHIILDSGHGGCDPGAVHGSRAGKDRIYEDELAYDVALRMKKNLERKGYFVHHTLFDPDQLKPRKTLKRFKDEDEMLLTHPRYRITNPKVGINLRIYLINHIYDRLVQKKNIPKENIFFLSIHADALHDSIRGATVYYPDHRLRVKEFRLKEKFYRKHNEYRKRINFNKKECKMAASSSKKLGQSLIKAFKQSRLHINKANPLRSHHYRRGKRTLPGVLRYSKIPHSVLIEVANLNNTKDRKAVLNPHQRQKIADSIVEGLNSHIRKISDINVAYNK